MSSTSEASIAASRNALTACMCGSAGAASAIKVMPQFVNVVQRPSAAGSPAASAVSSPRGGAGSHGKDLLNMGKAVESDMWQLLTAHENGQCLLWDISDPMCFQPIAKFAVPGHPARCASRPLHQSLA